MERYFKFVFIDTCDDVSLMWIFTDAVQIINHVYLSSTCFNKNKFEIFHHQYCQHLFSRFIVFVCLFICLFFCHQKESNFALGQKINKSNDLTWGTFGCQTNWVPGTRKFYMDIKQTIIVCCHFDILDCKQKSVNIHLLMQYWMLAKTFYQEPGKESTWIIALNVLVNL